MRMSRGKYLKLSVGIKLEKKRSTYRPSTCGVDDKIGGVRTGGTAGGC